MKQTGFTLVELLVVISIIGIITTIVVFQQRDASDRLQLDNAANILSLEIRKAQTFSLGVQRYNNESWISQGIEYDAGYGVYVTTDEPDSILIFADHPELGARNQYDEDVDGIVDRVSLVGGVQITDVCGGGGSCGDEAHVVFRRPDPNAVLTWCSGSSCAVPGRLHIELTSSEGLAFEVVVNESGRISIDE